MGRKLDITPAKKDDILRVLNDVTRDAKRKKSKISTIVKKVAKMLCVSESTVYRIKAENKSGNWAPSLLQKKHLTHRDMPIKGAPPNKGAPYGFRAHYTLHSDRNRLNFLNNWPIFIPKPPLERSEPQLLPYVIRLDLAIAPCAFIRQITVLLASWVILKLPLRVPQVAVWQHLTSLIKV